MPSDVFWDSRRWPASSGSSELVVLPLAVLEGERALQCRAIGLKWRMLLRWFEWQSLEATARRMLDQRESWFRSLDDGRCASNREAGQSSERFIVDTVVGGIYLVRGQASSSNKHSTGDECC